MDSETAQHESFLDSFCGTSLQELA